MPAPSVGPVTARVYGERIPEFYRDADREQVGPDYPLLRFLSLLLDQLTPVEQLTDRLSYTPADERRQRWQRFGDGTFGDGTFGDADTSDLVDPATADAAWLPWLAQLPGAIPLGGTLAEQRARLARPADFWDHGTARAIAQAIRDVIGSDLYVDVRPHHAEPFTIVIITRREETENTGTWGELEAAAPTWADFEALGDWSNLENAHVIRAAAVERPAGFRFVHAYLGDYFDPGA